MKTSKFAACCFSLFLFFSLIAVQAQESTNTISPRDQFKQYMAEWQSGWPNSFANNDLRTQIIRLATTLDPKPEIPEEARRHFIKAVTLQKDAQQPADYDQVIKEYDDVGRLAPWWPEYLYNRSLARESQGKYANTVLCLKDYLLTNPGEAEARKAQDKMYALEAKQEKAGKDQAKEQAASAATAERERKLHTIEGAWTDYEPDYRRSNPDDFAQKPYKSISKDANGNYSLKIENGDGFCSVVTFRGISDREFTLKMSCGPRNTINDFHYTLSGDGVRLEGTFTRIWANGTVDDDTVNKKCSMWRIQ